MNSLSVIRGSTTVFLCVGRFSTRGLVLITIAMITSAGLVSAQSAENQAAAPATISSLSVTPSSPAPSSGMEPVGIESSNIEPAGVPTDVVDPAVDPVNLLPDLRALPTKKTSLVGGTIQKVDRIKDELTVQLFGGGKMKIRFDPRTHIYNEGSEASTSDLRPGERVYVDTILNGSSIFARNIRMKISAGGESQGAVIGYSDINSAHSNAGDKGELVLRDALSPQPLKLRVTDQTRVVDGNGHVGRTGSLLPGTLVNVKFGKQHDGRAIALEVSILATPGANLTFVGRVTGLDLSSGLLTLTSSTDGKSYDIYLDPSTIDAKDKLQRAADVTVLTLFDGRRYVAQSVTVND
jgi:Domain of unknown function (DUF5666)